MIHRTPLLLEGIWTGTPTPRERKTRSDRQPAAQGNSPYSPDTHYTAIELSRGSKRAMEHHFPSRYANRTGDHVTLSFNPSQEELDRIHNTPEHRRTVNFHATHHADDPDAGIHAVRVDLGDNTHLTQYQNPHVTVSHAPTTKPVASNDLLARQQGDRINVARTDRRGQTRRGHLPLTGRIVVLPKRATR